jgi:PAS domain S-box-containing protein
MPSDSGRLQVASYRTIPESTGTLPAESALRASILDAVGEAVVAADPGGHILYWNDAARRLLGWSADEVLGSSVADLVDGNSDPDLGDAILRVLCRRGAWSGEFLFRRRDGDVFPAHVTATALRDESREVAAIVCVVRDTGPQREAQETARHAEQRLELVRRAAVSVLWEWDIASGVVSWSDSAGSTFGFAPEDVEPDMAWRLGRIHPEDRARVQEGFDRFLAERRRFWTEEYRFLTAERGYATVFERAYLALDRGGRPVRVVGTLVDLTERRRVREEQRFLSQASMILDLSMDYESTLPTIARLAVNSIGDICVLGVLGGDGFPPCVAAAHADPRLQALADDAAAFLRDGPPPGSLLDSIVRNGESRLVRSVPQETLQDLVGDAILGDLIRQLRPRSFMVFPLSVRRRTVGYGLVGSAAAERAYDEDDLRISEELGRRIGLTVDHARLFQSAELANRAKSDFLAVISHELRTPLTAVLGYAELLAEEVAGPLNETQHRQVARIRAGSHRLLRLFEGILTFVRLETGREQVQCEVVDTRALLEHAAELGQAAAAEKAIAFQFRAGPLPDRIRTDPDRFVQVVLSLLTNAFKFTAAGTVTLHAAAPEGTLQVDVTDSGAGIAPEHLPHIFNPFWQAEQPATRRAGGAGLGLSVARRLARLMNGDVLVHATTPRGTTFRFELPLV